MSGVTTGGGSSGSSILLFHHRDHLGSTVALTSSTGSLVEAYRYSAWGVPEVWKEGSATITNSGAVYQVSKWSALNKPPRTELLYTGRPYSYKTKLSDLRARVYSPYQSRFLQRDPIGYGDGMNVYLYVGNSPLMYVDRDGMKAKSILGEGVEYVGDVSTHIFLTSTAVGGSIAWLDVSSYMLTRFMYWDWRNEYYGSSHWISEKAKASNFYKETLEKARQEAQQNGSYTYSDTWDIGNSLFDDFPTSFWTVNWTISASKNEDGSLVTNFYIKDVYIYNDHYTNGEVIENPFNVFAKNYQDRGYAHPFTWEMSITQQITN